jgi:hypothetical protein
MVPLNDHTCFSSQVMMEDGYIPPIANREKCRCFAYVPPYLCLTYTKPHTIKSRGLDDLIWDVVSSLNTS